MKITDTIGLVLKQKDNNRVLSIAPEQTVYEALEDDGRARCRGLAGALQSAAGGHSVGARLRAQGILKGHTAKETQVHQIMTSPVVFVSPEHTVDECMTMMTERHIRHLPVLQDDKVVGVISIGDLVKCVISGQAQAIQALQGYITGAYPG